MKLRHLRYFLATSDYLRTASRLKWEQIKLTGRYRWRRDGGLRNRKRRPLRVQDYL
jgi:hypothetical protein